MKYEKRYCIGIVHKAGPDDFVAEYVADNGKLIRVSYIGNTVLGYRVDGRTFSTLNAAKEYCEEQSFRDIRDIIVYTSGTGKKAIIIGKNMGGYHVEISTEDVGIYIRDYQSWNNVIRTINRFGSWHRDEERPHLMDVSRTYAAWKRGNI